MTRFEIWFQNEHHVRFAEMLANPLLQEAITICKEVGVPLEARPRSDMLPNQRAADQKHWDNGFMFALDLIQSLGRPPKKKAITTPDEGKEEYDHLAAKRLQEAGYDNPDN